MHASDKPRTAIPPGFLLHPVHLLALGLGAGCAPRAPGTFGSLAGVALFLVLANAGGWIYLAAVGLLTAAGVWLCHRTATDLGVADHPAIVWDEICGFLITMIGVPADAAWILLGFCLFRFFDIVKPWPVGLADRRVQGGLGIMLDDILAGALACGTLHFALAIYM